MAFTQDTGVTKKIGDRGHASTIPVVYKSDLDAHRRQPGVRARLQRVKALIELRAQQKV